MSTTWTIYKHTLILPGDSFGKSYIGITCRKLTKRWLNGKGYRPKNQPIFAAAIKKYGWNNFSHEILETNISTLEQANIREQYWIAYYHTWVYDPYCNGYNNTQGGDGTAGHKWSEQLRLEKQKRIYCFELDKIFDSISAAAQATGCSISKISLCCNGLRSKTGGYHWAFIDNANKVIKSKYIAKKVGRHIKKVYCQELNKIYSSAEEAALETNSSYTSILKCCNGVRKTAGKYHWNFVEEN